MRLPAICLFGLVAWAALMLTAAGAERESRFQKQQARAGMLSTVIPRLMPLHEELEAPEAGDWLYAHREPGQTFRQYVEGACSLPTPERRVIYVQPLGTFTKDQRRILVLTAKFLCLYFHLKVRLQKREPLEAIPARFRPVRATSGAAQLNIAYMLGTYLRHAFPADAAARVAVTSADLKRPAGRKLTSVYGMAYLYHRTAIASVHRMGSPDGGRQAFRRCLRRTLKLVTHETGHALSMRHCKRMACNLNGRNSLMEMDRKPLWLCPHCAAKVCWGSGADPVRRFERLRDFCGSHGLTEEEQFFAKSARALGRWSRLAWLQARPDWKAPAGQRHAGMASAGRTRGSAARDPAPRLGTQILLPASYRRTRKDEE